MILIDKKSVDAFWELKAIKTIVPYGNGHINDTYRLETAHEDFILQRVNKSVFRTKELVENYQLLVKSVNSYQKKLRKRITPQIFETKAGTYHHIDKEGFAWRLAEFIPDSISYGICPDPSIAFKAAKALGEYQLFLNTLDPVLFQDTIVGFHDLPKRYEAFQKAVQNADKKLLEYSGSEVEESLKLAFLIDETYRALSDLPVRLNHNDTKLDNVLFVGEEVLIIDLDTVMTGNVMYDFGDMVRTFTSPAMEDEKDISKTTFRIEFFEALTKAYLEPLRTNLSQREKESLLSGALYIIYEQVLRFLTDYLNGNLYYKVAYSQHNLVRTRAQLKLLKAIIMNKEKLQEIILKYS